jgi:20S proteasome alpha/beta subunit
MDREEIKEIVKPDLRIPEENNEVSLTTLNHAVSISFNDKQNLSVEQAMELAIKSLKEIVKMDGGNG